MDETKERETGEIEHISLQMNGYAPRDLLQRFKEEKNQNPKEFISTHHQDNTHEEEEEEEEEIELNLGLSLGGCFGVDPKANNNSRLLRSSSIAGLTTLFKDDDLNAPQPVSFPSGIIRTCSLPTETEEEWRKRKELQSFRRMEAKRKRSEKQRNCRMGITKDRASFEGNCEVDKPVKEEEEDGRMGMNVKVKIEGGTGLPSYPVGATVKQEKFMFGNNGFSTSVTPPPYGLPFWAALSRGASVVARNLDNGKPGFRGLPPPSPPGSQGSSGISEFETKLVQGLNNCAEARSPSSVHSLPEQKNPTRTENPGLLNKIELENPLKKPKVISNGVKEMGMKMMDDMPCVSTRPVGPDGRRIEGFLYKYRKGEEVRIVCVCHGSCYSPAEFVKHAGGGDVAHPLRHIVVSPSPSLL